MHSPAFTALTATIFSIYARNAVPAGRDRYGHLVKHRGLAAAMNRAARPVMPGDGLLVVTELAPEGFGVILSHGRELIPTHGVELRQFADRVDGDRAAKHVVETVGCHLSGCWAALSGVGQEVRAGRGHAVGYVVFNRVHFLGGLDFPQDFEGLRGLRAQMRAHEVRRRNGSEEGRDRECDRDLRQCHPCKASTVFVFHYYCSVCVYYLIVQFVLKHSHNNDNSSIYTHIGTYIR